MRWRLSYREHNRRRRHKEQLLDEPACAHSKKRKSCGAKPKPWATAGGCAFDAAQGGLLPIADLRPPVRGLGEVGPRDPLAMGLGVVAPADEDALVYAQAWRSFG